MESGEPVHFETPSTIADRMMEMHAYPGEGNLTVLFRDVTERYRLGEELRETHARAEWLARFPAENPNPVMRASTDATVLYCNPASIKNREWACRVGDPLPEPVRALVAPALTKGEEIHREVRMGANFYAVTVTPFPEESYVNVYGREITKRKQAEEALRQLNAELEERVATQTAEIRRACESAESERQRFYGVLEMLPVYVVLLTADYHVPFANRFFRERFGGSHGKRCYEYLFQRTEPCEICETYAVLKTGKPHHWEWTGPDGRNYDVFDFPFTDEDGAHLILEMGIDITEIKRAEAALKEANETLEQRVAERTAELESFSYTISHDLRAPLRAIDGYTRMILRKHTDRFDDEALDKLNIIRGNTRMMGQLIEDLLTFSRLGRAQLSKAPLNIERMLRETWEELIVLNPDRRMTLKIGEIPPGRGDRALIKQVLVNILANTVKFTRGREEALIEVGGYSKDGEIVYWVRDNGVGFDMQYHDKMFGVFQRLHSAEEFEGTGVGLAIVQRIMHRHGGRVWAEGQVDRGACFYFSLPR